MKDNIKITPEEARKKTLYRILAQITIRRALKRRDMAEKTEYGKAKQA